MEHQIHNLKEELLNLFEEENINQIKFKKNGGFGDQEFNDIINGKTIMVDLVKLNKAAFFENRTISKHVKKNKKTGSYGTCIKFEKLPL